MSFEKSRWVPAFAGTTDYLSCISVSRNSAHSITGITTFRRSSLRETGRDEGRGCGAERRSTRTNLDAAPAHG